MNKGVDPDMLVKDIMKNLNQDLIVLEGAKLGWSVASFLPGFVRQKLLNSEG